jgi:cytochrome c556
LCAIKSNLAVLLIDVLTGLGGASQEDQQPALVREAIMKSAGFLTSAFSLKTKDRG